MFARQNETQMLRSRRRDAVVIADAGHWTLPFGFSLLVALFSVVAVMPLRAADFECPRLAKLTATRVEADVDALLPKGALDEPSVLLSAATLLREHGFTTGNAINHLVGLYCPIVAAEDDLSAAEKSLRIRQFAKQATATVLQDSGIDKIVYDIEVSPDVAEQAKDRAEAAGLSVEGWISNLVKDGVRP